MCLLQLDEATLQLAEPIHVDPVRGTDEADEHEGGRNGAGAGDGRGIHSDYSRDSSDRDASFSSNNTDISSGGLSEVTKYNN